MNDSEKLLPFIGGYHDGNYIIENVNIITPRTNQANVTFKNCTLNCEIYNEGNLTINDDCIFGENLCIDNQSKGNIIINDTDSLIPYYSTYDNGNYTIENVVIGGQKTIRWNSTVTIINATINSNISNMGNVIIINSTINSTIQNNQNLTMKGICIFGENYYLNNYGNFINETKDIPIEEPTENTVIITPETIDILISEYGSYDNFIENYTYLFQGNFKNTTTTPLYISIWNTNHRSNITLDGTNATFTNTVLAIDGTNIRIQNMKINNTNAYGQIISLSGTANNIQIINNNFSITNNINENYPFSPRTRILKTHLAKNILIENNTFLITAPTTEAIQQVDWPNINTANPVAIVCGKTTNITITNNYIGITNNIETTDNGIDGITITNSANVQITKNTINITGSNNITPINTIDTEQTTIENNTIIEPEIQKETTLKVYLTTMIIGQTVK
ncbi:MAG: hypothetical protein IKF79_06290, partial [Methanosphaera sp.]|nr:hypothetical protein [Methanosphaera sp.]